MPFRTIAKIVAPALALLALTAAVYRGNLVTIDFPDGWSEPEMNSDGIVTSRQPENGTNCNVEAKDIPAIAGMTMAEINAEYGHVFDVYDWADFLGVEPANIDLIRGDIRPLGDAYFHITTLRLKAVQEFNVITRYGLYVLPGRVVMAGCYVNEELDPIYTTTFETTISSLRPW